jgi:hypothetical protein
MRDSRVQALDAVAALADLNQRIVGGLIELTSGAALEAVRTYAELQAATVDALRPAPTPREEPRERGEGPAWEATGWYRRTLDTAVDDAQKLVKLLEKDGQILARSAERSQSSVERTGKEIREALEVYAERMRKIFGRN